MSVFRRYWIHKGIYDLAHQAFEYAPARSGYINKCDLCTEIRTVMVNKNFGGVTEFNPREFYLKSDQNICLQAVSLGLGTVPMGAFHDDKVKKLLNCEESDDPLYLMPVGKVNNK